MNQTNRADAERRYRMANKPRMRNVNNLGVWVLTDVNGVRVAGNDMESTYARWIEYEYSRTADNDYGDLSLCCYEDALPVPSLKALAWSALGLLAVISLAALYCVFYR